MSRVHTAVQRFTSVLCAWLWGTYVPHTCKVVYTACGTLHIAHVAGSIAFDEVPQLLIPYTTGPTQFRSFVFHDSCWM
jgi:hypothetical protein